MAPFADLGIALGTVAGALVAVAGGAVSGYVAARRKLGDAQVAQAQDESRIEELRAALEHSRDVRQRERELHERERELTDRHVADMQQIAQLRARVRQLESALRQAGRLVPGDRREFLLSDAGRLDEGKR